VSYFATLLARSGSAWTGDDLDLDDVESLEELTELVHEHAEDADTAVLLVEHEGEWFGVLRTDVGEDDPRVYVSDAHAALRHALGELLLPDLVEDVDLADVAQDDVVEPELEPDTDDDSELPGPSTGPAGDPTLLADLGVGVAELEELSGPSGPATSEAVAEIARRLDAADALESVR
jgi:putative tRNA adenosine deaminase-associated protein